MHSVACLNHLICTIISFCSRLTDNSVSFMCHIDLQILKRMLPVTEEGFLTRESFNLFLRDPAFSKEL